MSLMKWVTSPFLIKTYRRSQGTVLLSHNSSSSYRKKRSNKSVLQNSDILTELSQFSDITEFGRGLWKFVRSPSYEVSPSKWMTVCKTLILIYLRTRSLMAVFSIKKAKCDLIFHREFRIIKSKSFLRASKRFRAIFAKSQRSIFKSKEEIWHPQAPVEAKQRRGPKC